MSAVLPVLGRAGDVVVYTFGVVAALAAAIAGTVAASALRRLGLGWAAAVAIVAAAGIGGLAGARLWWLVGAYGADPRGWPSLAGGLVWWGGVLGGAPSAALALRAVGVPLLRGADALAPALALGLALGRIGCHLAGDGDWGTPTALPWGVSYEDGAAGWPHPLGVRVHPAPLYESAASFGVWARASAVARAGASPGRVTAWWALLAGGTRVLVEAVRTNPPAALGLTAAQLVGLGCAVAGGVALSCSTSSARRASRQRRPPSAPPQAAGLRRVRRAAGCCRARAGRGPAAR